MVVRYLWANRGATHQPVSAMLQGHPHKIGKMPSQCVGSHKGLLTQRLIVLLLQTLACNDETTCSTMGGLHQRLVQPLLPCQLQVVMWRRSGCPFWESCLKQQLVAPQRSCTCT